MTRAELLADLRRIKRHADAESCTTIALRLGAALHHLTPRAPFADVRVRKGDLVRVCFDATSDSHMKLCARPCQAVWPVLAVCPFRGILTACGWFRSWIIIKPASNP